MGLKITAYNRKKKLNKRNLSALKEKRMFGALKTELYEKLKILEEVDSVEIEVAEHVASIFMDIVMNEISQLYEYQQVDNTHFIFTNKEIDL